MTEFESSPRREWSTQRMVAQTILYSAISAGGLYLVFTEGFRVIYALFALVGVLSVVYLYYLVERWLDRR